MFKHCDTNMAYFRALFSRLWLRLLEVQNEGRGFLLPGPIQQSLIQSNNSQSSIMQLEPGFQTSRMPWIRFAGFIRTACGNLIRKLSSEATRRKAWYQLMRCSESACRMEASHPAIAFPSLFVKPFYKFHRPNYETSICSNSFRERRMRMRTRIKNLH